MAFADDLENEADNIIAATKEIVKRSAISVFNDVVTTSPVGNKSLWENPNSAPEGYSGGRFRSNWFLTNVTPSTKKDESIVSEGAKTSSIQDEIATNDKSSTFILTNNMDYSEAIEAGHSTQAKQGVVSPAVARGNADFSRIRDEVYRNRGIKK